MPTVTGSFTPAARLVQTWLKSSDLALLAGDAVLASVIANPAALARDGVLDSLHFSLGKRFREEVQTAAVGLFSKGAPWDGICGCQYANNAGRFIMPAAVLILSRSIVSGLSGEAAIAAVDAKLDTMAAAAIAEAKSGIEKAPSDDPVRTFDVDGVVARQVRGIRAWLRGLTFSVPAAVEPRRTSVVNAAASVQFYSCEGTAAASGRKRVGLVWGREKYVVELTRGQLDYLIARASGRKFKKDQGRLVRTALGGVWSERAFPTKRTVCLENGGELPPDRFGSCFHVALDETLSSR